MPDTSYTTAGGGSQNDPLAQYYNGIGMSSLLNPNVQRPQYGLNGLITGWSGPSTGGAAQNYSGLFNNNAGTQSALYNPTTNNYNATTAGQPVWNGSSWVSSTTGQPFTGTANGQTFNNGQSYQQMANDPNSRYAGINIQKTPGVANQAQSMISGFKPTDGISNFSDLLNASRSATATATSGLAADQKAYDVQPFADTMNSLNAGYANTTGGMNTTYSNLLNNQAGNENQILNQASGLLPQQFQSLQNLNSQYGGQLGALDTRYGNVLGNTANSENQLVGNAYSLVPQQLNSLNNLTGQFANTAGGLNQNYSNILGGLSGQLNRNISQANTNLGQYDTAAQNIADQEAKALQAQLSRYKLGTGTPMSLGSGEESMLLQGLQNIELPTQLAKIQAGQNLLQNYTTPLQQQMAQSQVNQLTNYTTPLAQQIYGQNYSAQQGANAQQNDILRNMQLPLVQQQGQAAINQIANYTTPLAQQLYGANYNTQAGFNQAQQNMLQNLALPLATQQGGRAVQQLTGFTAPLAQQNYQNAATTAQTIKNLQLQTVGMSIQDAANYMKTMAIPDQIMQQVLQSNQQLQAGNISNLGGLNSLFGVSNYQGLQDKLGANPTQPQGYSFSPPGGAGAYPGGGGQGGQSRYPVTNNYYVNPQGVGAQMNQTATSGSPVAPAPQGGYSQQSNPVWSQNPDKTWTNNVTGATGTFDANGQFQQTSGNFNIPSSNGGQEISYYQNP